MNKVHLKKGYEQTTSCADQLKVESSIKQGRPAFFFTVGSPIPFIYRKQ